MSRPTDGGKARIKRVASYLVGAKRLVSKYKEMEDDDDEKVKVDVYVDSDWASGWSRKSTSGEMLTVSGVGVKHWSSTQKARALSSGEAEYYATVTGCAEGLGMQSLVEDLGWTAEIWLWTDSSAAKAIGNRRGLGKLRHVELKWRWVQDIVKEGRVKLKTVKGNEHVADHLTKPKSKTEVEELLRKVGAEFVRWELALGGGVHLCFVKVLIAYGGVKPGRYPSVSMIACSETVWYAQSTGNDRKQWREGYRGDCGGRRADVTVGPLFFLCDCFQSCVFVVLRAQTARQTVVGSSCAKTLTTHCHLCLAVERRCLALETCFSSGSHGAAVGRVAASATDDAEENARVDDFLRVGEERQEREEKYGAVGLAPWERCNSSRVASREWVGCKFRFLDAVGSGSMTMRKVMTFGEEKSEMGQAATCDEMIQRVEALPGTNDDLEDTHGFVKEMSGEIYNHLVKNCSDKLFGIVRSMESGDGVEPWVELHQKCGQRTTPRMMRVLMECMYPKEVKKSGLVQAIFQWEMKWNQVTKDQPGGTNIPELWRMTALMKTCPKETSTTSS